MVGKWLALDEQMVRCVHRTSKFMQRHMPNKPIKNGELPARVEILRPLVWLAPERVLDRTGIPCRGYQMILSVARMIR